jgi:hypothetical protein
VAPPPDSPYYARGGSYDPNAANGPPPYNPNDNYPQRASQAYREQEKARTVTYGVAKFIDYLKWVLLVLEVLFGLRFLLRLLGADPANPFASFLYALSGFFLAPFRGLVHDPSFGVSTLHVFEWTTLIGMLIYALVFWIVWLLLRTSVTRPHEPVS